MRSFFQQVYTVVRKVPRGKVVTYGQVARLIGKPGAARTVGWALHAINNPYSGIPWHRVINGRGGISSCTEHADFLQRKLLEAEGVHFGPDGTIDLTRYQWRRGISPRRAPRTPRPGRRKTLSSRSPRSLR